MPRQKKSGPRGTTDVDAEIGRRIKTARLLSGISQAELGDQLGVSFQQVQKYEKGTNRVGAGRITDIARTLKKPVSYFIDDVRVKPTAKSESISRFMSTREGTQLMEAAMDLPVAVQQNLINIARQLHKAAA